MKSTNTMITLILIFLLIGPALADEALDKTAALAIVDRLTSEGRDTWIPAGTIQAKHQEYRAARTTDSAVISKEIERQLTDYKANPGPEVAPEWRKMRMEAIPFNVRYWMSNEYTMDSSVIVRYDGSRYYWEINVESRTDSVTVPSELRGNDLTEQFNLDWNQRRVFVWDGRNHTIYTDPVAHAMVDAGGSLVSPEVHGPLTAGLVAWGQGYLTYENLSKAKIAAANVSRDGKAQIDMTVERADGASMYFALDPAKDYAVTSCSLPHQGGASIQNRYYSGYQQVAGCWVPTTVLIEDREVSTGRVLRSDKWDFILVDGTVPGAEAFSVEYNADTTVEYHSPVTGAATFNYSNMADTDQLLAERLTYAATKGKRPSNCATVALKHAASQLGKTVSEAVLAKLVRADGQTTLYDLKQAAQGLGLYCRAVQTDIKTLANLPGCVAILHLPGKNHFVVLDHVDEQYAWLVDLSSNRFYYRLSLDTLPIDWPQGTALLLSSRSIQGPFRDIGNSALSSIVGAVDGWACTKVLQEAAYSECIPLPGDCTGYLRVYPLLYGCEPASNASCTEYPHDRLYLLPCYWDPERGACRADEMYVYLAKACDPD